MIIINQWSIDQQSIDTQDFGVGLITYRLAESIDIQSIELVIDWSSIGNFLIDYLSIVEYLLEQRKSCRS